MRMYTFVCVVVDVVDVDDDDDDDDGHQFLYAICTAHVAPRKPLSICSKVVQEFSTRLIHKLYAVASCNY